MILEKGRRIGPYEVQAPLGAGGMGEVWRATDTRLGRDVALKLLPAAFASDPDRLARFEREAKLLASLSHTNIAGLFALEEAALEGTSSPVRFLAMELAEGEDLATRLKRGAIPVDESLAIAQQIAEALEEAHEKGIVHRDLKPANVKLTPDGKVKVLDFGLAKAYAGEAAAGSSSDLSQSPTLAHTGTQAGVILGTAAYMSPEQARGKPVDRRADIWAFGVVLFEMLTGQRLFTGETVSDTLASILKGDPDWTALPQGTPRSLSGLLRRCLRKDPRDRLRDIGDARLEIQDILGGSREAGPPASPPASGLRRALPWIAAALAAASAVALWAPWRPLPPVRSLRFDVRLAPGISLARLALGSGAASVLSPNGDQLAFVGQDRDGRSRIYTRPLDRLDASALAGTEGARNLFFSPDGQWIGFFAGGKLQKVSVSGGAAITLCDARDDRGGAWGPRGDILFAPGASGAGLYRVSAEGGASEPFTKLDTAAGEVTHRWPQWLPGGDAILYTANTHTGNYDDATLVIESVPGGPRERVYRGGYYGRYLPGGPLLFVHDGTLFAAAFDLAARQVTRAAIPVIEQLKVSPFVGAAQLAFSEDGTFVYAMGGADALGVPIQWLSRDGTLTPLRAQPANWAYLRFSPAGDRLAMRINDRHPDVWVFDWARDTLSRLTFDADQDQDPVWTPDGRRIVFTSFKSSPQGGSQNGNLFWLRSDGSGEAERLTQSPNLQFAGSWHPSGTLLAFAEQRADTRFDVMLLELAGDEESGWKPGTPTVLLGTRFEEATPVFSPDGRFLAYASDESGQSEVYVRPFPGPGGKWQVSAGGGADPKWSRTHREILYLAADERIMRMPYSVDGDTFRPGKPARWSDSLVMRRSMTRGSFDLHPDGERLALQVESDAPGAAAPDTVVFITNFSDELRRLTKAERR